MKNIDIVVLSVLLATLFAAGDGRAVGGESDLPEANINVFDTAAVQRGARLFVDYCAGCHSAKYMRYKRLAQDLGYSDEEILEALAPPDAKIGDAMTVAAKVEDARTWFGIPPPDLSLVARIRGTDWVMGYLEGFYRDPERPLGWNNIVFENASMPNPLWALQGIQEPVFEEHTNGDGTTTHRVVGVKAGTPGTLEAAEFHGTVRDLVTFLAYLSEPARLERHPLGKWVLMYLVVFALLAWLLKHEYWKDVE